MEWAGSREYVQGIRPAAYFDGHQHAGDEWLRSDQGNNPRIYY